MNIFHFQLFVITTICLVTYSQASPSFGMIPSSVVRNLRKEIRSQGCSANICFAIDGSGSITPKQFKYATNFVQDVVNVLSFDRNTEFAAFQYGYFSYPIFHLTKNRYEIVRRLEYARAHAGDSTNMGAGIYRCSWALASRRWEPNKIVVISDGRNNVGGNPVRTARFFTRWDSNGRICSVVVGKNPYSGLLRKISNYPVLTVNDYIELGFIVTDLVKMVCNMK